MAQPYTYGQITKGVDIDTPTITINGVTPDNYLDLCKVNGITPVVNANGEIVGWQYTQSESELTEDGYIERLYKVQMSAKKNSESTSSNVIIDFVPTSDATTSTRYKGSIQVNVNRNDYAKAVLKTAGVNLDLATVPDSVIDEMWSRYLELAAGDAYMMDPTLEGAEEAWEHIEDLALLAGSSMMQWLRGDPNALNNIKSFDSVDNLAAILSVCAQMGMFTPEDIFGDDPETKAAMMQAQAGDHIQLKPPTDENGETMPASDSWLGAFLRPMMFAARISGIQQLPTAQEFENGYTWPPTDVMLWQQLSDELHASTGYYPNIWITELEANGSQDVYLAGMYCENEQYEIHANYPSYGYAEIDLNINPNRQAAKYRQFNRGWYGYGSQPQPPFRVNFIYSFEDFYNYFTSLTTGQQQSLQNQMYVFANCNWIPGQKPYITYDPDYIHLTPDMTPEDIIDILPTERPNWWDDRDTEVTVDPKYPDVPITKVYLPVGVGTNTPTVGNPAPENITGGYPITIPSITIPINTISQAESVMTPTAGSSKFWTIYNPSDANMDALGGELWNQTAIQILKQTFVNPTDGIISWHQIFVEASDITKTGNNHNIMLGDYQTNVTAPVVTNNVINLDCGILTVPTFYNDYRDITETEVSCYLPYIGFVDLDPRDVIGCKLTLKYRIDIIMGTCVANISPSKGGIDDRNVSECAYMFTGNCAVQLPITAADRSRLLSSVISGAANGFSLGAKGGAIAGHPIAGGAIGAVAGGIIGGIEGYHGGVAKCNGFNANAGALSIYRTPYIIVQRSKPADPSGAAYHYGAPASKLMVLREAHGFTRVREAYINIPRATENEKAAIDAALKSGIYLN